MRRLSICLAAAVAALVLAPTALADGPVYVSQGGPGVASHDGAFHYVALPLRTGGTLLEKIEVAHGQVYWWKQLPGSWGIATIGNGYLTGQGLSRDGRALVLASMSAQMGPSASPSKFLVVDPKTMKVSRKIVLDGSFSFDAIAPDASRLYLIQYEHASSGNLSHYIVRGYDMRTNRLMPGRIVDRIEKDEKTMTGYAMSRATSADGRWVYTLYQKPSGAGFVHALDTKGAAAYCIDLPRNKALYNIVLSLRDGGRTLAVRWRSGRPWLNVATGSWQISYPSSGFPWKWVGAGIGGGFAVLAVGALLLWRRRNEEVEERAGQELGLA
jgi:MYXO-CTERM domain-containing protein